VLVRAKGEASSHRNRFEKIVSIDARKLNEYSDCASLRRANMQSHNEIPAALQPGHHFFVFFAREKRRTSCSAP
jgi:hypothetical protein